LAFELQFLQDTGVQMAEQRSSLCVGDLFNQDATEAFLSLHILDDAALTALDRAAQSRPFDLDLLQTAPARDMRRQMEVVLDLLENLDHRAFLSKQNWFAKLTGADVEARLKFELSAQQIIGSAIALRKTAQNGQRIIGLLGQTRDEILSEQARFERLIEAAKSLIVATPDAEAFTLGRFERRLSNIMALHSANIITLEQIGLAESVVRALLDRFTDVDTILLPLWQRNALAMAHSSTSTERRASSVEFYSAHKHLITYLKEGVLT
jgi:hypothetical protein